MFADNTNVFMANKYIDVLVNNINEELDLEGEWLKANKRSEVELSIVKSTKDIQWFGFDHKYESIL